MLTVTHSVDQNKQHPSTGNWCVTMYTLPNLHALTRVRSFPCDSRGYVALPTGVCGTVQPFRRIACPCSGRCRQLVTKAGLASPAKSSNAPQPRTPSAQPAPLKQPLRVVVLGSGWGAVAFIRNLDAALLGCDASYTVQLVSPRNYFMYTPLLPAAATGCIDPGSIAEPVRNILAGKGEFVEAECLSVDVNKQVLHCKKQFCDVCAGRRAGAKHNPNDHLFDVPYDILVVAVGAVNNTFGVKGVTDHCYFLKTMEEARALRSHVSKLLEIAALPSTTEEERKRLLSFVVVGGGPSGVELAAEMHDLFQEDVARLLPHIKDGITMTLVHTQDHLLNAYDRDISAYTTGHFMREGIHLMLDAHVESVDNQHVVVKQKGSSQSVKLPYGTCVWCTGIAISPLAQNIKEQLSGRLQTNRHGLVVDDHLRVQGAHGRIFALGDCATMKQRVAAPFAARLFEAADRDGDGQISRTELEAALQRASAEFPHLADYLHYLQSGWRTTKEGTPLGGGSPLSGLTKHSSITVQTFAQALEHADERLRPLPATAQVARQQGEHLARLFSQTDALQAEFTGRKDRQAGSALDDKPGFTYHHLGSLAYIGAEHAVMKLPFGGAAGALKGWMMGQAWRGMETFMQVSVRSMFMVATDFLRTKLFGRNISDV